MRDRPAFLLLACTALLYGILQWQLPHHAFWSNDGGEKLVQVKALVASGFKSPAIPYDPLGLEPTESFEFAPFLPGHARVVDGRLLSVVPVYFPLLSALPYKLWGHAGLYLIPLAGTVLTLISLLLLAQRYEHGRDAPLIVTAAGLASPLFFYSLTFWEHTLAAGLCTAATALIHRRHTPSGWHLDFRALAAGLLMAIAAWVRGEVFVLLLAYGLAMLFCHGHRRLLPSFALATALALIPYALINHTLYASAASPQLPATGSAMQDVTAASLLSRWLDVSAYLLTGTLDLPLPNLFLFLLGITPALALFFLRQPSFRRDALAITWCALLCLASLLTLSRLFFLENPMGSSMTILGLFGSLPFLPLALVQRDPGGPQQHASLRFPALAALLSLVGLCLCLPSRGGLQWGPRYALPLVPLLIFLAVTGFVSLRNSLSSPVSRRTCTALFLLMILTGMVVQGFGVNLLYAKKQATSTNMREIEAMAPRVIITDTWWVPEDNGDLYGKYPVYSFYTYEKMGRLLTLLAARGEWEVLLVSSADYREFIARQPGLAVTSFAQTTHPGMTMFNLSLHTIRLGQP